MPFVVELVRTPEEETSAFLQEARVKLNTGYMPGTDKWVVDRENDRVLLNQGGRSERGQPDRSWLLALDRNGRYRICAEETFAKRDKAASTIHRKVSLGWYSAQAPGNVEPDIEALRWVAEALKVQEQEQQHHFFKDVKLDVVDSKTGEAL